MQAVLVARDYIIKKYGDILCVVRKRRSETQKSETQKNETQYHRSLLEQMTELSDSLYEVGVYIIIMSFYRTEKIVRL